MAHRFNLEEADAWIETRPQKERLVLTSRAKLRLLPAIGFEFPRRSEAIALAMMRVALTQAVASARPSFHIGNAGSAAIRALSELAANAEDGAFRNTAYAYTRATSQGSLSGLLVAPGDFSYSLNSAAENAVGEELEKLNTDISNAISHTVSAFENDTEQIKSFDVVDAYTVPLWPDAVVPQFVEEPLRRLRESWSQAPQTWGFWARWYDGMLNGQPMDWELQEAVALKVPEDVWEKGAAEVAAVINEIENDIGRRSGDTPKEDEIEAERERSGDALRRHVQGLLRQPKTAEINAVGLAMQIKSAVDAYRETGDNDPPNEVQLFDDIANVLAKIGGTLAKANLDKGQAQRYAADLEAQIAELQLRIKALEVELVEAQSKQVKGVVKQGFLWTIGSTAALGCCFGALNAATFFVAPEHSSELTQHFGEAFMSWFEQEGIEFPQIGVDPQ